MLAHAREHTHTHTSTPPPPHTHKHTHTNTHTHTKVCGQVMQSHADTAFVKGDEQCLRKPVGAEGLQSGRRVTVMWAVFIACFMTMTTLVIIVSVSACLCACVSVRVCVCLCTWMHTYLCTYVYVT